MRILTALTYYRPHYSGLTIYAEREARALVERGHQVTVLTSRFDKSLPTYEIQDGVEIFRLPVLFRISKGVIMPSMPLIAWKLIKNSDVVQLHVPQLDAALIAMIARLMNKPIVLTYHCDLHLPSGFVHTIANAVSNFANYITASLSHVIVHTTSDYAENSPFLNHFLAKVRPVFLPIELESITQDEENEFSRKFGLLPGQPIIGMVARLATEKGVEYLAEALLKVLESFPNARVLFVGPYKEVLGEKQYASRLAPLLEKLGAHWTFFGILSPKEMTAFFRLCNLTVLPSINSTESYGLVQVESMYCGTPVVASDLPGVRIPVQKTGMGLVVPIRDPEALAEAIINILQNPEDFKGDAKELLALSHPELVASEYEKIFQFAQAQTKSLSQEELVKPDTRE